MSWLTRIEAVYGIEMEKFTSDSALHTIRRMARVIRELAGCLETFEGSPGEWSVESHVAFSNLSPDAKEVIDDSTAPRST